MIPFGQVLTRSELARVLDGERELESSFRVATRTAMHVIHEVAEAERCREAYAIVEDINSSTDTPRRYCWNVHACILEVAAEIAVCAYVTEGPIQTGVALTRGTECPTACWFAGCPRYEALGVANEDRLRDAVRRSVEEARSRVRVVTRKSWFGTTRWGVRHPNGRVEWAS